jgi:putative cell wall-binding protein
MKKLLSVLFTMMIAFSLAMAVFAQDSGSTATTKTKKTKATKAPKTKKTKATTGQ